MIVVDDHEDEQLRELVDLVLEHREVVFFRNGQAIVSATLIGRPPDDLIGRGEPAPSTLVSKRMKPDDQ